MTELKEKFNLEYVREYMSHVSIDCVVVCIYLICLPFTIVTTPVGSLLKVISVPILAVLAVKLLFGKCKKLTFNSVHLTYTLYMLYSFVGLLFRFTSDAVTQTYDMTMAYLMVMMMTMRVYNEHERKLMEHTWILLGVTIILLGNFSTTRYMEYSNREYVTIAGNVEDPNQFCAYFLVPITLCLRNLVKSKAHKKAFYVVMIILLLYTLMRGGSRGGLIAVICAAAFYVFAGFKSVKTKIAITAVGVFAAVAVVGVVMPLLPEDVSSRYSVESVKEDGGSGRFDIWAALIEHTAEKPDRIIRGEGIMATGDILTASVNVNDTAKVAHNQFVQVFTDQGIIGLMFYLFWVAACFLRPIKKRPEYSCAYVGIVVLSCSLTSYVFKPMTNIVMMCAMEFDDDCDAVTDPEEISKGLAAAREA